MIIQDIRELKTGPAELRKFGLLVGGIFAGIGLLLWLRHKPLFPWLLTPGLVLVLCGAIIPRALKWVYLAWMSLAIVLGFVVSNLLLTLLFLLVITPVGLAARALGKDFLSRKPDASRPSYWIRRPPQVKEPGGYEQQF